MTRSRSRLFAHSARLATGTVGLVLAGVLLFHSLRGIEWREVLRIVMGASRPGLVIVAAIATMTLGLRSLRWRLLLGAERSVSLVTVFWATAAGYLGNTFLPARAGELGRIVLVSSRCRLDSAYVLATAIAERAADAIALIGIGSLALLAVPGDVVWWSGAIRPLSFFGLAAALAIALLPKLEQRSRAILERIPLPLSVRNRLLAAAEQGHKGLRAFHNIRRLLMFGALTVSIWCLDAFATVVGGAALGLAIPPAAAFLLLASLGLGSALPSTPGYVGIYQFAAVLALTPFGFSRADAIAYILVAQAVGFLVIGWWGGLAVWHFRTARRRNNLASSLPADAPNRR
jgi:glycosyltransferase 2 family protein